MAKVTEVAGYKLGKLLIEGKTKQVYELPSEPDHVLLLSKDRIKAGNGVEAYDLPGKAAISNKTNAQIFEFLNSVGVRTAFVRLAGETSFISKKCEMIPIVWVTTRLATGSFLERNEGVKELHRFRPPKFEAFYKDEENNDPQWSEEQIISAKEEANGLVIGSTEVDIIRKQLTHLTRKMDDHTVVILMESPSDEEHCKTIESHCEAHGLYVHMGVASANKGVTAILKTLTHYENVNKKIVYIAVAGRSNSLGSFLSGNTSFPVINCPPVKTDNISLDSWSSLNVPSGLGCATVLYPEAAALHAATIVGLGNFSVWARLRCKQFEDYVALTVADARLQS